MSADAAAQAFETVMTLAVFVVILYVIVEALEAAPLGFESSIDDRIEDTTAWF